MSSGSSRLSRVSVVRKAADLLGDVWSALRRFDKLHQQTGLVVAAGCGRSCKVELEADAAIRRSDWPTAVMAARAEPNLLLMQRCRCCLEMY